MKPGEVQTYLPPPPHKIVDYLNGSIIGHNVMKKAISVAIYNHFCNINFSRIKENFGNFKCPEEALVEDAKHYFTRDSPISVAKSLTTSTPINFDNESQEYMSPVVAKVIIEAASHKVRLRCPNVLTFDSTGPSKPVNAISSAISQLFETPFIKCDCTQLSPIQNVPTPEAQKSPLLRRAVSLRCARTEKSLNGNGKNNLNVLPPAPRPLERRGSLTLLMSGCDENKETINSVISKLYRKADFDLSKAQRGVIFLDGMDKIGSNQNTSEIAHKQVLNEILQVLDGQMLDVTRAGSTETECIDTSQIFFVCFGNFEEKKDANSSQNQKNICLPSTKFTHSPSINSLNASSSDSGNGSGEQKKFALKDNVSSGNGNNVSRRDSGLPHSEVAFSELPDQRSELGSEEGYSSDEDDSYEGLEANKMAQTLTKPTIQTKSTFLKDSRNTNAIEHYQSLWGMKDIELKFSPEALEVIANQATMQNAGQEGMHCILEKLFLNLKFDMPPDITTVEITEDVIMGRAPPHYQRKCGTRKVSKKLLLTAIDEDEETDEKFITGSDFSGNGNGVSGNNRYSGSRRNGYSEGSGNDKHCRPKIRLPSRLSDYDMAIWDQMEI